MKKNLRLMAVAVFMFGMFGLVDQAMAYFSLGDLIEVVYQGNGGVEQAFDLGSLNTLQSNGTTTITTGLSPTTFTATYSDLYVGFFVTDGTVTHAWVSGPTTGLTNTARQGSIFQAISSSVLDYYALLGGASPVGSQTSVDSYVNLFDKGNNSGSHGVAGNLISSGNTDASLAALATGGSVTEYLYYFSNTTVSAAGTAIAKLVISASGTEVEAVPIPAAVYLFGSGLVGILGWRRKIGKKQ